MKPNRMPCEKSETPWGPAQVVEEVAVGIVRVCTAGHGGYWVSAEREAMIRELFPEFEPFACAQWYEEDCDWAIVALAHAVCFSPAELRGAVRTVDSALRSSDPRWIDARFYPVRKWLHETSAGWQILNIVAEFDRLYGDKWEVGSLAGGGGLAPAGLWSVSLHRVKDKAERIVYMPYPLKHFYTDAELEEAGAQDVPKREPRPAPAMAGNDSRLDEMGHSDADPGL